MLEIGLGEFDFVGGAVRFDVDEVAIAEMEVP